MVTVTDGRRTQVDISTSLPIPAGGSTTDVDSDFNTLHNGLGVEADTATQAVVRIVVVGTMPAGTEVILTPVLKSIGDLPTITKTLDAVTNAMVEARFEGESTIADADFIRIEYKFKQGGAPYAIGDVTAQIMNAGSMDSLDAVINTSSCALRVEVVNPPQEQYSGGIHFVDESNQAAATYRKLYSRKAFLHGSIQWNISGGVTLKIYASNDETADTSSLVGWADVTKEFTGSLTQVDNDGIALLDTGLAFSQIMVEWVCSDASNATDVWTYEAP
jgi:hypothetical protein